MLDTAVDISINYAGTKMGLNDEQMLIFSLAANTLVNKAVNSGKNNDFNQTESVALEITENVKETKNTTCLGDPINMATGSFVLEKKDFILEGTLDKYI